MNIKDLKPGSYSVTLPASAMQGEKPLNIKDISGQYKTQADLEKIKQQMVQAKVEGAKAQEFLGKPWYKQLFTPNVAKELPGAAAEFAYGEPARFAFSTLESPMTLLSGGQAPDITYKVPGLAPFKSYQSELQDVKEKQLQDIEQGKQSSELMSNLEVAAPIAKTVLGGVQTGSMAKALIGDVVFNYKPGTSADKIINQTFQKNLADQVATYDETAANTIRGLDLSKAKNIDQASKIVQKSLPKEILEAGDNAIQNSIDNWTKTANDVYSNLPKHWQVQGQRGLIPKAYQDFTNYIKNKPKVSESKALEMITEQPSTPTEKESLLRSGKATKKGIFGKVVAKSSADDVEVAKASRPFLEPDPVKSIDNMRSEIERMSEEEIKPLLQKNDTPFTKSNLRDLFDKIDELEPSSSLSKSDPALQRTAGLIKEEAKKIIKENVTDNESLLNSRKLLDRMAEQETKGKVFDVQTTVSDMVRKVRGVMNDHITQNLPENIIDETGKTTKAPNFKDMLKYQSRLYKAIDTIASKNYKILGKSTSGAYKALQLLKPLGIAGIGGGAGATILSAMSDRNQ